MYKFLIFITFLYLSQTRNLAVVGGVGGATGSYCDNWNKCPATHRCVKNKCIPIYCNGVTYCGVGFNCQNGRCISQSQIGDTGVYCDFWTPCRRDQICVSKKCVAEKCTVNNDCAINFMCYGTKCISNDYIGSSQGYCDKWTKCPSTHQCVNKKCVKFTCNITPDCSPNYLCSGGFCVQINNNHTRGRYCDAENQCDILHVCRDFQCFSK